MQRSHWTVVFVCSVAVLACNRGTNIDKVPAGTEVQVIREDGGLVEGKLQQVSEESVKVDTGRTSRLVRKSEIADVRVVTDPLREEPPARATFREVLVPADTKLSIELDSAVSSESSGVEERVTGSVIEPVVVDGTRVIPAGSTVRGVVSHADPSGKVKGRASLGIRFDELLIDGVKYPIAAVFSRQAPSSASRDAKTIGVPAIGGAVIGGLLGGKKGAAIGAAAGGGAGAAVVLTHAGQPVALAKESVLTLSIGKEIDVRVPVH